ncbi:MAG: hypothetical protein WDN26_12895 [Chitinophagaceae bacterium]
MAASQNGHNYFLIAPLIPGHKPKLMISRPTINRIIIIGFMVLVGFMLAKGIYSGSVLGIILALTSLGAGIYFLYLLVKAKQERDAEEMI